MNHPIDESGCLRPFSHPRYFYGQLLDVRHFESEHEYFKRKQRLLNRMVSGYGVVCGLDVQLADDEQGVVVRPGLALDKRGREIVVPRSTKPLQIEALPPEDGPASADRCEDWQHLVLCYDEQLADPEAVLAGGCEPVERCAAGTTRETYKLELREGKVHERKLECQIPNLIKGNGVNYRALADWVSGPCNDTDEACITLANIRRPAAGSRLDANDIDIAVRPIVFTLYLLWEVLLDLTQEGQSRRTGMN